MAQNAKELSTGIVARIEQIDDVIDKIENHLQDIARDIQALQGRKRSKKKIDEDFLKELKGAREKARQMIRLLAFERTELLDRLPEIQSATERIKAIASDLEGNAALMEQKKKKLGKATELVQKAEEVLAKIIALAGKVL